MIKPARMALCLLLTFLLVCGFECDLPERRPIAAVTGTAYTEKPNHKTIASVFAGVAELLKSKGFEGGKEHQPSGYRIPGGREYSDGFWLAPSIGCTVDFIPKSLRVEFYEWESPNHSARFPATDDQRAMVRALAHEIENYLRTRLPLGYNLHVAVP